jgi:hypothetical protein
MVRKHELYHRVKFKKVSEDSYSVIFDGEEIGEVARGWFRVGGNSWTHNLVSYTRGFPTRKEATKNLIIRWIAKS